MRSDRRRHGVAHPLDESAPDPASATEEPRTISGEYRVVNPRDSRDVVREGRRVGPPVSDLDARADVKAPSSREMAEAPRVVVRKPSPSGTRAVASPPRRPASGVRSRIGPHHGNAPSPTAVDATEATARPEPANANANANAWPPRRHAIRMPAVRPGATEPSLAGANTDARAPVLLEANEEVVIALDGTAARRATPPADAEETPRPAPELASVIRHPTPVEIASIRRLAGFPDPPEQLLWAPIYAIRALARRHRLARELACLRRRNSPDVALYEAAMSSADPRTIGIGLTLLAIFSGLGVVAAVLGVQVVLRAMALAN